MLYFRDSFGTTRCAECGDEVDLRDHFGPDACLTGCPSCWQRSIDPDAPEPEYTIERSGDTVRVDYEPGYAHTYLVYGWVDDRNRALLDINLPGCLLLAEHLDR